MRSTIHACVALVVTSIAGSLTAGCALQGAVAPPPAPLAPAPVEFARLRIVFRGESSELGEAVAAAMRSAGMSVVAVDAEHELTASLAAHDLTASLEVTADSAEVQLVDSEGKSIERARTTSTCAQSRTQLKFLVPGSATRSVQGQKRAADEVEATTAPAKQKRMSCLEDVARRLVNQLGRSERLVKFARGAETPRESADRLATAPTPNVTQPHAPSPAFVLASPQPTAYAVVIGVERYGNGLPAPTGARADAERFAELARRSLGIAPSHIKIALDGEATKGTIERHIAWATESVPPGGRLYVFFSGHGAPDASDGTAYLVPVDGDPKYLAQSALRQGDVLRTLAASKAKEVLVVLDACFSGAGERSVLAPGARPLVRVKEERVQGQLALLTASSGTETSGPATGGSGGLFTQTLLAGLGSGAADIDGDGQITLQELYDWVKPRVARAAKSDNRDQTPSLVLSPSLGAPSTFVVAWGLAAR